MADQTSQAATRPSTGGVARVVDPVLTMQEVAQDLRCSKSQVSRLLNGEVKGVTRLPHIALGRRRVVLQSVLEAWKRRNLSGMIPDDSERITVDAVQH